MDFCIGYWPKAPARLLLTPLGVEDFHVFGPPGTHGDGPVALADLAGHAIRVPARHGHLRATLRQAAQAAGVDLDLRSDANDWDEILARVRDGDGLTVAPLSLGLGALADGDLGATPLGQPPVGRMVSLLSRAPPRTTEAALFVASVVHTLAERWLRDGLWSTLPEATPQPRSASGG